MRGHRHVNLKMLQILSIVKHSNLRPNPLLLLKYHQTEFSKEEFHY